MKIFKAEPSAWDYFHSDVIGGFDRFFIQRKQQDTGFYRMMFDEDFSRLFRSMAYPGDDLFNLASNDNELTQNLLSNVRTNYSQGSFDEIISELVEEIAQSLIYTGIAYYFLYDGIEKDKTHIAALSSIGVTRVCGMYIQWVPKRKESHWERGDEELPREIRILDKAKVMRFILPKSIKRMLFAQNKTLSVLDRYKFRDTDLNVLATYENPNPINHFDFGVWRDIQERALYISTRTTGWNGRMHDSSKRSDFFDCHRLIRFRRNQITLRDSILKQLSTELSRVGRLYREDFSVDISATDRLLSITLLNDLELRLKREEVGFNEIIEYCYKR
ncbi:hypothetical protein ABVF67_003168 [Vibrio parahaemolyticus]|uniref:hypothetical protein n=1 Tax=Vibrio parahaemolyticus TaxID=670 RepID=UPI00041CB95B|nr:hypothetical protein [Vibrio parahaemolyticus]